MGSPFTSQGVHKKRQIPLVIENATISPLIRISGVHSLAPEFGACFVY
jgi:hypothetical protein